jgi:hypothetical protein
VHIRKAFVVSTADIVAVVDDDPLLITAVPDWSEINVAAREF